MSYHLDSVTLRSSNAPESIAQIAALWADITGGRLPLLFDSDGRLRPGISPISCYRNYESDETGAFDMTVMAVTAEFFTELEAKARAGSYRKFEGVDDGGDLGLCAKRAWEQGWSDKTRQRAYAEDYESTVPPQYTKDGKAHCYLYLSVG